MEVTRPNNFKIGAKTSLGLTFIMGEICVVIGEWDQRRKAAIELIELVERLDRLKLSMCDVKGTNFGSLDNGKSILIDADTLFTRKQLGDILEVGVFGLV